MSDLPIIFSAPMVRGLLREVEQPGTGKTQTRRLAWVLRTSLFGKEGTMPTKELRPSPWQRVKPGDRLWVRESLTCSGAYVQYAADGRVSRKIWPAEWKQDPRPSIHMPRWASRLTLVVTAVRVEPLHAISLADIRAEGMTALIDWHPLHFDATDEWRKLWTELHGHGSWDANPEVVVLSFSAHRCNIDAMERAAA